MSDRASGSARQLERITAIDRKLRGNQCPTTGDLARELGVSERTVYRDLVFLRDRLGAPLTYDARRRGYRYTRPHQFFPGVSLTPQEVASLLLVACIARPLLGNVFAERVRSAVQKILGAGAVTRAAGRGDGKSRPSGETEATRGSRRSGDGSPASGETESTRTSRRSGDGSPASAREGSQPR